ncbi:MAG: ComF family protein [Negativicutes bacterium]|nr:ComF family protein [Negativicutes bacterium]
MTGWGSWWKSLVAMLFPHRCPGCGRDGGVERHWCEECLPRDLWLAARTHITTGAVPLVMLFAYRGPVKELLHRGKFHGDRGALLWLAAALAQMAPAINDLWPAAGWFDRPAVAVPVPLAAERLRQRGYNQVELIFRRWLAANRTEWRPAIDRSADTLPQYKLSGHAERRRNVRGCFRVTDRPALAGQHVLLVDDVVTSGATVSECVEVLQRAGVKKISGLALCTARPQDYR